ncbi:amphi-Trp domain-containing protein [Halohasta salina]|uniref:amphi-Trp domain-containing protein n=1 Tax=Halohasta salina TaxID=2961621 RepID=UPI0020A541C7|nr:amphi-Trp domain-containing protein [Halohasta salina]
MAEKTHHETTLSQSEAAAYLQTLGNDLAAESGSWLVPVGNKEVTVHPDTQLDLEATVDERSRLLGDDITEVTVQLRWTDREESAGGEGE